MTWQWRRREEWSAEPTRTRLLLRTDKPKAIAPTKRAVHQASGQRDCPRDDGDEAQQGKAAGEPLIPTSPHVEDAEPGTCSDEQDAGSDAADTQSPQSQGNE
ncbi:hypothetical protein PHYSODRAFT_306151 [Phytophthora sojae]|uniref:Uncharacterized protein n=1 Tax=Phytophthora sojae (strain P6497) TaxID=1094619 RepID=G5A836_PHYSP|nr:hypothetical protein PHYSODRAFT_306151 [Phytophthora sojae]EGZ08062.1 hypothetical protein PHYSODRAFT_306151 [Phytophthora sojae]|eukprot:XP_009536234.1 hypothetical protein PHYSODRAFT_306151 [Phytophthora sojae]